MKLNIHKLRMYLNGVFAALTCPCHAIFYVYLLSGTTIGAILSEYEILFMSVLGIAFPFFIFMVAKSYHQSIIKKEMGKSGETCEIDCESCRPGKT